MLRMKPLLQRVIARMPRCFGDPIYHSLQAIRGLNVNIDQCVRFVDRVSTYLETVCGQNLMDLRILELGSGWFPVVPLLLKCRGAQVVHTYDINRHYSKRRIRKAAALVEQNFGSQNLLREVQRSGELPSGIEYHPKWDLTKKPPGTVFDLCVSRFVLEHISPDALTGVHRASHCWLRESGYWIHWVSPGDHRSYDDYRIHRLAFLEMSEADWDRKFGNRFAYHNRLRRPQYLEVFRESGFDVLVDDCSVPNDAGEQISRLDIHDDFSSFTAEDLLASSCWFVLRPRSGYADR